MFGYHRIEREQKKKYGWNNFDRSGEYRVVRDYYPIDIDIDIDIDTALDTNVRDFIMSYISPDIKLNVSLDRMLPQGNKPISENIFPPPNHHRDWWC